MKFCFKVYNVLITTLLMEIDAERVSIRPKLSADWLVKSSFQDELDKIEGL